MPDVREVFEMATQKVRPDPGAMERQYRHQRRRSVRRKVGGYALVAAILAIGLIVAIALSNRSDRSTPANTHSPSVGPSPTGAAGGGTGVTPVPERVVVVSLDGTETAVPGLPSDAYGLNLSPDGKTIAFVTNQTGTLSSSRIATIGIDGTGLKVLSNTPTTALMPDWSPDGSRIAFQADGPNGSQDVYTMKADGSDVRRVVSTPADEEEPQWSPDGSHLLYYGGGSGPFNDEEEISSVPATGGRPVRLTHNHVADLQPAWSPDGTRIAFVRSGRALPDGTEPLTQLWLMNADGSHQRRMTAGDAEGPVWSPDGTRIAVVSFAGRFTFVDMDGGVGQEPIMRVGVVDVATGALTRVGSVTVATFRNRPQWVSGDALLIERLQKPHPGGT